jgi:ABC-type multidrug transport system fused ATPase/permease subunit
MDMTAPPLASDASPGIAHRVIHAAAELIGHQLGDHLPDWMHPVLHAVLIWGPLAMLALGVVWAVSLLRRVAAAAPTTTVPGLQGGVFGYILRHSRKDQAALIALGLLAMPVLYATLELPKIIINNAIDADRGPVAVAGAPLDQLEYLLLLSALYLVAVTANGALKFGINVYKGRVGERLLRRLRLTVYRRWRAGAGPARRAEVIPLVAQEVEPIGGFAANAFAAPVFQGGTFATILVFMFMQDPILGAAAITLLPVQLVVIPRLQRRVNLLARSRATEMRRLGGQLGEQAAGQGGEGVRAISASFKRIEEIRRDLHRRKFFMKAMTNFLTALTPFFFYSIGGWLVIEGSLTLGALVAALAAHKDFSAPLRELLRYYETREDVRIRYAELLGFLLIRDARPSGRAPVARLLEAST